MIRVRHYCYTAKAGLLRGGQSHRKQNSGILDSTIIGVLCRGGSGGGGMCGWRWREDCGPNHSVVVVSGGLVRDTRGCSQE